MTLIDKKKKKKNSETSAEEIEMLVHCASVHNRNEASSSSSSPPPRRRAEKRKLHVVVIVLGDLGRSPRMQYHALSLLQEGHSVSLVGYDGEDLITDLRLYEQPQQHQQGTTNAVAEETTDNDRLADDDPLNASANSTSSVPTLHVIRFTVPTPPSCCGKIVYFLLRILALALWTTWTLLGRIPSHQTIDAVLVQNPPALPLLLVAWLFCTLRRVRQGFRPALIIDWHNLGYSMLSGGLFQRVARVYERTVAPLADAHWTVTTAMRQYLVQDLLAKQGSALKIQEVPDCPPDMFRVRSLQDQHDVLKRLGDTLEAACPRAWRTNLNRVTQTMLTEVVARGSTSNTSSNHATTTSNSNHTSSLSSSSLSPEGAMIRHRRGRPALLTSSTSWTPDEDFGILLQALLMLDDKIQAENSQLNVLVVVTGKGPQKTMYERKISQLALRHVAVTTLWLEPQDYPRLLAAADLGVSLHTSTSGLDLPMKVLDLFGCQVPVCAMKFACLDELVQDGVNGRVFENSEQLAQVLWELLSPLTATPEAANHAFGSLAQYSAALRERPRWHDNWCRQAWPVLEQVTSARAQRKSAAKKKVASP